MRQIIYKHQTLYINQSRRIFFLFVGIFIAVGIALMHTGTAQAQGMGWGWQNSLPQGNNLFGISCAPATDCIAVIFHI